jgi:hypothetical protein
MKCFALLIVFQLIVSGLEVQIGPQGNFVTKSVFLIDGKIAEFAESTSRKLVEANLTFQTDEEKDYLKFHRCFGENFATQFNVFYWF